MHLSVHIQETKKGRRSFNYPRSLTPSCQVHAIVLLLKPRLLDLDTRVTIRYGWNLRVTILVGVELLAERLG